MNYTHLQDGSFIPPTTTTSFSTTRCVCQMLLTVPYSASKNDVSRYLPFSLDCRYSTPEYGVAILLTSFPVNPCICGGHRQRAISRRRLPQQAMEIAIRSKDR